MKYIKDGLSMDETRISALIVAFLITLGFALWQVVTVGEISENLLTLLSYEIMAITGINVADKFSRNKNSQYSEYDDIGG